MLDHLIIHVSDPAGMAAYYERVLGEIVTQNSYPLSAQVVANSQWYEIDDADDLAAAEERFASTNATEK